MVSLCFVIIISRIEEENTKKKHMTKLTDRYRYIDIHDIDIDDIDICADMYTYICICTYTCALLHKGIRYGYS